MPISVQAICPRSSVKRERRFAKAEVAGATPAVDAILQDCGVTVAFLLVTETVRVRIPAS